jgi:hypothetical protein
MNKYWESFIRTGKIDDYLNYIACAREENMDEYEKTVDRKKEGGFNAGVNGRDGDSTVGHADWRI